MTTKDSSFKQELDMIAEEFSYQAYSEADASQSLTLTARAPRGYTCRAGIFLPEACTRGRHHLLLLQLL